MISKKEFVKIIENDRVYHTIIDKIEKYGISFYESEPHKCYYTLLDILLGQFFNSDGMDLIYWWLYEDVDKVITNDDDSTIELNSAEDLYNYLVNTTETKYVYLNVE
jgi:hypothetical protein